jgi:hypothetical protein
VTATATADRPAAVTVARDTTVAVVPGAQVRFTATVVDRYGNRVAAPAVRWATSDGAVGAIDSLGTFVALASGSVVVTATADTARGQASVVVARPAPFTVTRVPTDTLRPGADLAVDGEGFAPQGMSATVAGVPATVASASATRLVIRLPGQGALPCAAPSLARVVIRRQLGGVTDSVVAHAPLDPATPRALQPGERVVADEGAGLRCTRLVNGGRYVAAIVNTSTAAPGGVAASLRGRAAGSAAGGAVASRAPLARAVAAPPRRAPDDPAAAAHARHLARERARLTSLGAPRRAAPGAAPGAAVRAARIPTVGDAVTLNAMFYDCAVPTAVRGRVAAVGTRSVVVEDVASPGAGTRDAVYRALADEYDRVMHPLVTANFGDPLALDARLGGDGLVRILVTPYVADSVPGTAGFMTGCNFYPKSQLASSNEGAVFYARLPSAAESAAEWRRVLRPTLVHEAKHLAAYAERFARAGAGAPVLEETWLEEATARAAEELYARTFSGAAWKGNAAWAPTVGCEVAACDARPLTMYKHFSVLADFYARVDSLTPLGPVSRFDGTYYASGWLLVRWAADHFAADESAFFRALTTEVTATGIANLVRRAGRPAPQLVADWALALAVDDRPGFTPRDATLAIPSWHTRDVFRGLNAYSAFQFPRPFPLLVRAASAGDFAADVPLLRSFTAAYIEISGVSAGAQLLSVEGPAGLVLAIVRID